MMWLSYEELRFTGNRKKLLDGILGQNDVTMVNGEILTSFNSPEEVGPALFNMIRAIMQTSSLRCLSSNNVVNTSLEDVLLIFKNSEIGNKCLFKKEAEVCDGDIIEPDIYIDLPIHTLVFGAHNTERSKEVFINMLLIRESKLDCRTMVIIDEGANIPQKDRDRLINMADRPVIGMNNVMNAIKGFIPS